MDLTRQKRYAYMNRAAWFGLQITMALSGSAKHAGLFFAGKEHNMIYKQTTVKDKKEIMELCEQIDSLDWEEYYKECEVRSCPNCGAIMTQEMVECWKCGGKKE